MGKEKYTIKDAAQMMGVPTSTIRYYDKEGLLPFMERMESGYRIFTEKDIATLRIIDCLKKTGMPIKEIRQFTDWLEQGDASLQQRYEMFLERKRIVEAQMAELQETLNTINYKCWYYETAIAAGTEKIHETKMSDIMWTKEYKIERYRKMNETAIKGKIVFAGSSLMEMFPIEQFVNEDQLNVTVYNRGIGGFVTEELLANINTCIIDLAPSKLFINIGTNDLSNPQLPISEIMDNYGKILAQVKKHVPNAKIYLMAYYPVNYEAATDEMKPCLKIRSNDKIRSANKEVALLAQQYHVNYIDVNAPLLDEDGNLKTDFTIEGMHINEQGYRTVYPFLKQYIME